MSLDTFYIGNKGPTGGKLVPPDGGGHLTDDVAFDSFEGLLKGTSATKHPNHKSVSCMYRLQSLRVVPRRTYVV